MSLLRAALFAAVLVVPASACCGRYEISVLTCSAGSELYAAFGHSALLVKDVEAGRSSVYNFGLFDFSVPHFYFKFIRGDLDYYLGKQSLNGFVDIYTREGRSVQAQRLSLGEDQAADIVAELEWLMLPANRAYRYKFIDDNCTTALRDLLLANIDFDDGALLRGTGRSYRDYIDVCLEGRPWGRLGVDLLLGANADREADIYGSMFLPGEFYRRLYGITDCGMPVVEEGKSLNGINVIVPVPDRAGNIFQAAVFAALAVFAFFSRSKYPAVVFFTLLGLLGTVLLFVTLFSLHGELLCNFNVLWCTPLWLVVAAGLLSGKRLFRNKPFFFTFMASLAVILICLASLLVVWIAGIQAFEPVFLLIVIASLGFLYRGLRAVAGL